MTDITTTKDFQQRMFERVRSQIGDLLTDEDLQKIVAAAMEQAFFEREAVRSQFSGSVTYDDAPFVKMTRELLNPHVTAAVQRWMSENAERVQELVVAEMKATLPAIVLAVIKGAAESQCMALVEAMRSQGLLR